MHPVILQPGAQVIPWMETPSITVTDIPAGLEYLVNIDYLRIKRLPELIENTTSLLFIPNRYVVENIRGEQIFVTTEQPDSSQSSGQGCSRGYKFDMYNKFSRLAFRIERTAQGKCDCVGCYIGHCIHVGRVSSIVESPAGTLAGSLFSKPSLTYSKIDIRDGDGNHTLSMKSVGCCGSKFMADAVFNVDQVTRNNQKVAVITKRRKWHIGDVFEINCHPELEVRMKASIIGATILLDFTDFNGGRGNSL